MLSAPHASHRAARGTREIKVRWWQGRRLTAARAAPSAALGAGGQERARRPLPAGSVLGAPTRDFGLVSMLPVSVTVSSTCFQAASSRAGPPLASGKRRGSRCLRGPQDLTSFPEGGFVFTSEAQGRPVTSGILSCCFCC